MKPSIESGDIVIRRVSNGWIVFVESEHEPDHFITLLYEIPDTEFGEQECFMNLLGAEFPEQFQSKYRGGVRMELRTNGRENEDENKQFARINLSTQKQKRELKKELNEFRYLYGSVISRINKLEDDTRAAIEFADLAEDDRGTEMILKFCDDITKLVGE